MGNKKHHLSRIFIRCRALKLRAAPPGMNVVDCGRRVEKNSEHENRPSKNASF